MKKFLAVFLVVLMLFGGTGAVLAQDSGNGLTDPILDEENELSGLKFNAKKEFQDEIHKINELRIERLQLRIEVIEQHDTILDLYIEAREAGNKEALEAAMAVKQEIGPINEEIKILYNEVSTERQAFNSELENNNIEAAKEHLDNIIDLLDAINDLTGSKIDLLEKIIEILNFTEGV